MRPSEVRRKRDGSEVANAEALEGIKQILSQEFICFGNEKVTWELHDLGFVINKKKVYRLMKEAHLSKVRQNAANAFCQTACLWE